MITMNLQKMTTCTEMQQYQIIYNRQTKVILGLDLENTKSPDIFKMPRDF